MSLRPRIERLERRLGSAARARFQQAACPGCDRAPWRLLGAAGLTILTGIAARVAVKWTPPPCRSCGRPGDDTEAYRRLLAAATPEEHRALRELVR